MAIGEGGGAPRMGLSAIFPPAWLAVQLALDAWTISQSWQTAGIEDMPDAILPYIYGLLGGAAIFLLWGLGVLALAWSDTMAFRRHFIVWQGAAIAWTVARQIWALAIPQFMFAPLSLLFPVGETIVSIAAIWVAAKQPVVAAARGPTPPKALSGIVVALLAVAGVVAGATVGALAGALAGTVIASATNVSCFEGGCGYFAAAIGLLGLVIGAVVGGILATWWAMRRRPAA